MACEDPESGVFSISAIPNSALQFSSQMQTLALRRCACQCCRKHTRKAYQLQLQHRMKQNRYLTWLCWAGDKLSNERAYNNSALNRQPPGVTSLWPHLRPHP